MNKLLEEIQTGTRTIAGTDWPVVDQLRRTGEREWTVVREFCNGVPRASETYRSEARAREAFESRIEGRKPRASTAGKPVTLRATDDERARWESAASAAGQSLSEYVREAVERAIAGDG